MADPSGAGASRAYAAAAAPRRPRDPPCGAGSCRLRRSLRGKGSALAVGPAPGGDWRARGDCGRDRVRDRQVQRPCNDAGARARRCAADAGARGARAARAGVASTPAAGAEPDRHRAGAESPHRRAAVARRGDRVRVRTGRHVPVEQPGAARLHDPRTGRRVAVCRHDPRDRGRLAISDRLSRRGRPRDRARRQTCAGRARGAAR